MRERGRGGGSCPTTIHPNGSVRTLVSLEPADVEERVLVIQELAVADGALEVRTLPECLPVENDHCSEIREVKGGALAEFLQDAWPAEQEEFGASFKMMP